MATRKKGDSPATGVARAPTPLQGGEEPPTEVVVAAANSRSFEKKAADHLVMTGCMAARCVYGYWFERGSPKTTTMINCCDEGNAHLPHFCGRGHLTAIDFNVERFNAAFIPDDPDGDGEHAAVEEQPGGWSGFLSYTLQGTAYGLGTGNWNPARFWREGDGGNISTFDFNAAAYVSRC